jgi:hypothetical protein
MSSRLISASRVIFGASSRPTVALRLQSFGATRATTLPSNVAKAIEADNESVLFIALYSLLSGELHCPLYATLTAYTRSDERHILHMGQICNGMDILWESYSPNVGEGVFLEVRIQGVE